MITQNNHNESEVARIRAAIIAEHIAAERGLDGFRDGNARHAYITKREENLTDYHQQLAAMMPVEEATKIMAEAQQCAERGTCPSSMTCNAFGCVGACAPDGRRKPCPALKNVEHGETHVTL